MKVRDYCSRDFSGYVIVMCKFHTAVEVEQKRVRQFLESGEWLAAI